MLMRMLSSHLPLDLCEAKWVLVTSATSLLAALVFIHVHIPCHVALLSLLTPVKALTK